MSSNLSRWGGPAAMMGGALYVVVFGVSVLIYQVFVEETQGTFFAAHAFIHMLDVSMFALLALGAVGVYARQKARLGKVGKAGFYLTLAGFGLSVENAEHLYLSLKTVRNHFSNIFAKLQVADRAQTDIRAREAGLG